MPDGRSLGMGPRPGGGIARRDVLRGSLLGLGASATPALAAAARGSGSLVPKTDFPVTARTTYLNVAARHPLHIQSAASMRDYVDRCLTIPPGEGARFDALNTQVLNQYAALINADPDEVCFIPSTTAGESLVVAGLGYPAAKGTIVTDNLHYSGSLYMYDQFARQGVDVRVVRQHEGLIPTEDMIRAIGPGVRLVALSLVAMANGFLHDLAAICAQAHRHGAIVYADVIQAVGATPFDVRESGVDVCASGSHKYLMGDVGLAFFYVRRDLLRDRRLASAYGAGQLESGDFATFRPPTAQGWPPWTYEVRSGAAGQFEAGVIARSVVAALAPSFDRIAAVGGVSAIQAHATGLTERLRQGMSELGHEPLSPAERAAHIVSFRVRDPEAVRRKLDQAGVVVRLSQDVVRASVSIFNDAADVDAFLSAMA